MAMASINEDASPSSSSDGVGVDVVVEPMPSELMIPSDVCSDENEAPAMRPRPACAQTPLASRAPLSAARHAPLGASAAAADDDENAAPTRAPRLLADTPRPAALGRGGAKPPKGLSAAKRPPLAETPRPPAALDTPLRPTILGDGAPLTKGKNTFLARRASSLMADPDAADTLHDITINTKKALAELVPCFTGDDDLLDDFAPPPPPPPRAPPPPPPPPRGDAGGEAAAPIIVFDEEPTVATSFSGQPMAQTAIDAPPIIVFDEQPTETLYVPPAAKMAIGPIVVFDEAPTVTLGQGHLMIPAHEEIPPPPPPPPPPPAASIMPIAILEDAPPPPPPVLAGVTVYEAEASFSMLDDGLDEPTCRGLLKNLTKF